MSKFYKEVATPESQGRQTVSPSGPSVDVNARQEAQNEAGGLGGAIQSLLGTVAAGSSAIEKQNKASIELQEAEFRIEANSDTEGAATDIDKHVKSFADKQGKQVWELTPEELNQTTQSALGEIKDIGEFGSKPYSDIIDIRLANKREQYLEYITKKNKKDKFTDQTNKFSKTMMGDLSVLNESNAQAFTDNFFEEVTMSQGIEIDASGPEIAEALVTNMIQHVTMSGNANAADVLKSKQFVTMLEKDFGMKDVRPAMNALQQATRAPIEKQIKLNEKEARRSSFEIVDGGAGSISGIKEYIADRKAHFKKPENKVYAPSTEFWLKLEDDLLETQNKNQTYDALGESVLKGEHTAIVSAIDLTEKEKREAAERLMFTQSGVDTSDFNAVVLDVLGGSERIATSLNNNIPASESLIQQYTTPTLVSNNPEKPFENYRKQTDSFIKLNGDTEGKLAEVVGAKAYNRIIQQDKILSRVKSGLLSPTDGEAQLAVITAEQDASTTMLSGYKSIEGMDAMNRDEGISKRFRDRASDASWTWDETKNQEQVYTFMSSTFHHLVKTGMDSEEAEETTYKMMNEQYRQIENPDGSEVFIPKEFKNYDWNKVFDAVRQTEGIKELYAKMSSFDKEWDGDLNVHIPRNYAARKHVIIRLGTKNKLVLDSTAVDRMLEAYKISDRESKLENYAIDLETKRKKRTRERQDFTKRLR